MSGITTFLNAILVKLQSTFPDLKSCETYPGQFGAGELSRAMVATPAMRLAPYEISRTVTDPGGETDLTLGLSLVVITKDEQGQLPREVVGIHLVEAVSLLLAEGQTFGQDNVFRPEEIASRNLYGDILSKKKVQLWDVFWRQTIRLGTPQWTDDGIIPIRIYASHAPEIGADHVDDYEDIHPSEVPFELP